MALINIDTVTKQLGQILDRLTPPQGVEILSYKRNRGITILMRSSDHFTVREHGYRDEEWQGTRAEIEKRLKGMLKREFPRSRKLRLYQLAGPEEGGQPRKKL